MQGLLLFRQFGHWEFAWGLDGARYFRIYARLLDRWSHSVVAQIRSGFVEQEAWDPVPAAVELLAIGARLLGEPSAGPSLLENRVAALFSPEVGAEIERGPLWRGLVQVFLRNREQLTELVISRTAATKGGSTRVQILDSAQLVAALRANQMEWPPQQRLPDSLPRTAEYMALRTVQQRFREDLDSAVDEERTRALARFARVTETLVWEDGVREVGPILREAMQRAQDEGVFAGAEAEDLQSATNALSRAALVRWKNAVETIAQWGDDRNGLLAELGQNHEPAARTAEQFVRLAGNFLDASTARVQSQTKALEEAGGRDLDACYTRIGERFDQLATLVAQISGTPSPAIKDDPMTPPSQPGVSG